jgi:hypothetical protein
MNQFKSFFTKKKTNKLNNALFRSTIAVPMPKVIPFEDTLYDLTSSMESTDTGILRKLLENLQAYKKACDNPSISQAHEYVTKLKIKAEVLGEIIEHIKLLKKVNNIDV